MSEKITYKNAGVDVEEGERFVRLIKPLVESTYGGTKVSPLGGFAGAFPFDASAFREPLLVSATDGVGTKLKTAFSARKFDTIGIDLVAMSVNDVVTCGARPLFFLDYLATSKLDSQQAAEVVEGICQGCIQAGCVLMGGETAEMPGFYAEGEFDLAGFCVGVVEKDLYIDGGRVGPGDLVIGLASSGLHSNGYSLARKVFFDIGDYSLDSEPPGLSRTLGEELLIPTAIYSKAVLRLCEEFDVKALAHVTGGGIPGNLSRVIPDGLFAEIQGQSWPGPPVFGLIMKTGNISCEEMYSTFNCGIGMIAVLPKGQAGEAISLAGDLSETAYLIGEIKELDVSGEKVSIL
ncbi:MAG: phosphoribosylformylglycinamidine cyclo-ligase [Candidatus Dadabacteria bacterium]|nr:phosphoribosylformylglycinamidine cyclo-ligase [Candidatus Dadabacteria bacterium]MYA49086.1 phosphoribosylformylglycinamidine cyclo-ligase [Candidatus Dadabacteria bacterium]MYG83284.1 phosphoribosylformylglycinamidine cyclo-ligase [Candidatus Dadabacteria bacterium]MYK48863.1 phosphoribosylformylglycinamidine cyclo-ligase [Candidatus Dadabacteria bacterium]